MKQFYRTLALLLCIGILISFAPSHVLAVELMEQMEKPLPEPLCQDLLPYCNSDVEAYSQNYCFYVTEDAPGVFMMGYEYFPYETEYREYLTRENVDQIAYFSGMLYYSVSDNNEIKQIDLSTMETKTAVSAEYDISRFAVSEDGMYYLSNNTIYYYDQEGDNQQTLITDPIVQRFWLADDNTLEYISDDDETIIVFNLSTQTTAEKTNSISELSFDEATSTETATRGITIESLKSKFPHGKYWNHVGGANNPDGYTSSPCTCHGSGCSYYGDCDCNSFSNAIQCFGYALKVAYDYYDSNPRYWSAVYNLDSLKAGDYIRYKRDSTHPSGRHSIWVTAVNGDTITYTDCNSTGRCQIRWEGTISKSSVLSSLAYVWSAPTPSSGDGLGASTDSKVYPVGNTATFSFKASGATSLHLYIYYNGEKFFEGQFAPDATYQQTLPYAGHYAYYIVGHYTTGDIESAWDDFQVVAVPSATADATNYIVGSTTTITLNAPGAGSVHLYIYYGGDLLFEGQYSPDVTYQRVLSGAGHYAFYMIAHYDNGDLRTEWGEFQAVEMPVVNADKAQYSLNETATFSFAAPLATSLHLYIYKGEQKYFEGQYSPAVTYQTVLFEQGTYEYYIIGHYPMGDVESAHKEFQVRCTHSYADVVTPPTCTEQGYTTHTCEYCGDSYTDTYVPALKHDLIHHEAQAPTCTRIGWEAYDTCSRCNYSTYLELKALNHDLIHHEAKAPTCTEIGWEAYDTCSRCDYTTYVEIKALDHDLIHHEEQKPTCTEIGWEAYDTCSRCDYSTYVEIKALDHDLIHHEAKAATCTEIGWAAYDTCTRCDYSTYVEIKALDHDLIHHEAKAATCTEIGWAAYDTCSRCDYSTYVEKAALGHAYQAVVTAPTCTEKGYTTYTCSRCGDSYVADEVAANGHTPGASAEENRVDPTCTASGGFDTVTYCSACGAELSRVHTDLAALNHVWDDGVVDPAPTCTTNGVKTFTCKRCGEEKTETIAALGHTAGEAAKENEAAATCTAGGSYDLVIRCTTCNAILFTEHYETPALGHDFVDGVCTRCGAEDPDYTEPTEAPTEPTEAPTEPTEAPTEPTEAPTEPTEAPTEPTEAPTEPTEAPTEPTEAPTEPTEPPEEVVPGDINGDGDVDTVDAIRLAKYLVDLIDLTDAQKLAADVNGDGEVTTTDAIRLAKYLVGLIETLRPEPAKAAPSASAK